MDLYVSCIFASLLLVSVGAGRYDQGPQRFYDVSDTATSEQNEREVIVYLTSDQVKNLEASGAVVRTEDEPQSNAESESAPEKFPQDNEDQPEEEDDETDQEDELQQEDEVEQEEKELLNTDIDFEEILRILNDESLVEEAVEEAAEEQILNEPQVEEENTEKPRNFSPKFNLKQQQKQQEYLQRFSAAAANKEQRLQSYSFIRYQPDQRSQSAKVQLLKQQPEPAETVAESEEPLTQTSDNSLKKKYKLIPFEAEETTEEPQQTSEAEENTESQATLDAKKLAEAITKRKNTLLQNEVQLQTVLRQLKSTSSKFNDQKYAIEIEKLRANLDKQNALSKAEAIAKVAPALIKQQIEKKRIFDKTIKQGKRPVKNTEPRVKSQQTNISEERPKPILVPVIKDEKTEVGRPIPVPVETGKRLRIKNIYVRTDKPFTVQRNVPENKKQSQEVPSRKPERITILRHVWEH